MAIDPRSISPSIGTDAGIADRIADLNRRIASLEANRSVVGAGTITGTQVSVTPGETLTAGNISAGAITADLIAAGAINAVHISAGSIDTVALAAHAVTTDKLAAGSVTANEIAASTITAAQIAASAITTTQLAAGAVTAVKIAANTITAAQIAASTITATQIAASTITATELAANSVTATQIAAGAVTATKISVTNLAAISTDLGSISAGTITGGTIQTAASGSRVVINSTGLKGYASDGTTLNLDFSTGSGIITVNGIIIAQAGSQLPAGQITGFLGGGNLLPNSSAENYPGVWTGFQGTLASETTNVKYGSKSLKITNTSGTNSQIYASPSGGVANVAKVEPGRTYAFSCWVKSGTTARQAQILSRFSDASGTLLPGPSPNVWNFLTGPLTNTTTTGWTRLSVVGVAPPNAVYSGIVALFSTSTVGEVFYADGFQIEEADVPSAYAPKPDEILPDSITSVELAPLAVTAAEIANNTITATQVANAAIGTTQLANLAVDTSKLAALAVDSTKLAAGSVTAGKIAALAVTAGTIAANAVTATEIAANAVTATQINAGAVTTAKIAALAVTTTELAAGAVTAAKIAADTITANEIAANAVTATELAAGSVTTTKMTANTIDGNVITTNTLTGGKIISGTVDTLQLAAGSVTASVIDVGAVTAQHLTVASPQVAVVKNGTFTSGTTGAAFDNWNNELTGGATWTTEADSTFGTVAKEVTPAVNGNYYRGSDHVILPTGRHVIRAWVKTVGITGVAGGGALMNPNIQVGTGSVVDPTPLTGTNDWTLQEAVVTVTSATANVRIFMQIGGPAQAQGTAYFANVHTLSSVTTTEISPGAITTGHIVAQGLDAGVITAGTITALQMSATAIDGFTITGSTLQTAASNPRIIIDASSVRHLDAAGVIDFLIPTDPTDTALFRGAINADGGIVQPVDANNLIGPGNKYAWLDPTGISEVASIGTSLSAGSNAYTGLITGTAGVRNYWKLEEATGPTLVDSIGSAPLTVSGTAPTYAQTGLIANEPSSKSILFAAASATIDPATINEVFTGMTIGNALNGFVGASGTWATSGATTDYTAITPGATGPGPVNYGTYVGRSTTADTSGRIGILGTTTFTDTEVGTFHAYGSRVLGASGQHMDGGVVARYVDASNYCYGLVRREYAPTALTKLEIYKVVAGVTTQLTSLSIEDSNSVNTWFQVRMSITTAGKATLTLWKVTGPAAGAFVQVGTTATATDTALATGGALASGKSGIYDFNNIPSSQPARAYDNFYSVVPGQRFDQNNWSWEGWVKPTNAMTDGLDHILAESRGFIPSALAVGEGFRITHNNGQVRLYLASGAGTSGWTQFGTSTVSLAQNSTYHVAVVVKGSTSNLTINGTWTIYINGVQRGTGSINYASYVAAKTYYGLDWEGAEGGGSAAYVLGNKTAASTTGSPFVGNIDEVAYYPDKLLTAIQITNRYNTGVLVGTPETKLTGSVQAPGGTLRKAVVLDDRGYGQLGAITLVSTLPVTGLYDGMEVYWNVGASGGDTWHMKYVVGGAAGDGWYYLGGGPLRSAGTAAFSTTATVITSGVSPSSYGRVTVPRDGSYYIEMFVEMQHSVAGGQAVAGWTPDVNNIATQATESIRAICQSVSATNTNSTSAKGGPVALTGGNTIGIVIRGTPAGTTQINRGWLAIYPKFVNP